MSFIILLEDGLTLTLRLEGIRTGTGTGIEWPVAPAAAVVVSASISVSVSVFVNADGNEGGRCDGGAMQVLTNTFVCGSGRSGFGQQ